MNNEIDHDLAERIGATHTNTGNACQLVMYYKIDKCDAHYWDPVLSKWCKNLNGIRWMLTNLKPIPPRPKSRELEYEYESIDFGDKHWHAARMICDGAELWCKARDDRFYKLTTQSAAVKYSQRGRLYIRKEVKRDWRDAFFAELKLMGCDFSVKGVPTSDGRISIDRRITQSELLMISRAALKAAGEGL